MKRNLVSSDAVFDPIQLGEQPEVTAPHQPGRQLLIAAHAHRRQRPDGMGHIRPLAQCPDGLLPLPEGLGIAGGVLIADGDQQIGRASCRERV